jgi:phosphoenolpyruvate-protein kinase (PTS system EI component)
MRTNGLALVPGIAYGPLWAPASAPPAAGDLDDFHRARERFVAQTGSLPDGLGPMYEALAFDPSWDEGIGARLATGDTLSAAVAGTAAEAAGELRALADPYLAARGDDLVQVGAQLVRLLGGAAAPPPRDAILCAHDVSPVELQGWAAELGGVLLLDVAPTAHLAIVARGLGLPAIALAGPSAARLRALAATEVANPAPALLNGFEGWLESAPDDALVRAYPPERIVAQPDPEPVVVEGRRIGVLANINLPEQSALGATLGADGIGLLRTEFLYVDRAQPPSLEEETAAYRMVATAFAGKPIVVRTLDLGGDKLGAGFADDGVDHGMLGVRGVRLTLRHPELFARHLNAIVDGFAGAELFVMFPMVAVVDEFERARDAVAAVVRARGAKMPQLGLMLEIPAAAYALAEFAAAGASFISLGTNDLAQYFFASDRLSAEHAAYDIVHRAAWREFLRDVIHKAKQAGLEAGVCGEAAGDASLSTFWLEAGVDKLSVAPGLVPWLKTRLRTSAPHLAQGAFTA